MDKQTQGNRQEPYNAGDPEQVKAKKTKEQLRVEREREELKALCADRRMRDFLWRIISRCGVYQQSFTGNSETFFREGKRQIGLDIIGDLMKADPQVYGLMRIENS